ncbi:XrtA/PEP-CTERM system TPR-repeat protein PrsT [Rhodoferax sp. OV413]|uniref:XrtA/PEP-CTERM system TPR-repeat protein PrsT n=1 Tax=Rhodoferax sp. OV413 TaxID=1855285 RepID=UPI000B87F370|nr:XrtA/PEP-CTERM system TPR-repeat protein PrsT [Rhodoferax sp. OV413]
MLKVDFYAINAPGSSWMPTFMNDQPLSRGTSLFRQLTLVTAIAACLAACQEDPMVAGKAHLQKENYPAAVIEFKNAVQANPNSVAARLALADVLERTYDLTGTEQHLRKALEAGGDADVLVPRIALVMLDLNEVAQVINAFKERRLGSPDADSNLRAAVAVAYVGQKQFAAADEQLKSAATKTAATLLARAQLLLAQEKKEQALEVLADPLVGQDAPWWILRGLGRVYEANGRREQAVQFMARAYAAAPWHRGVAGEYGEFLVGSGQVDQAIVIRDKLKKIAPGYYWTHYLDALVLSRQGRTDESLAAALKVLTVAPEHLPANLIVASAEVQKGDLLVASKRLNKIASDYPYSLPLLQMLAEVAIRQNKASDATAAIKRGLGVDPGNARLLSLQVENEVRRGAPKEAIAMLEKLRAKDPQNASYLLRLIELRLAAGDKAGGRKLLDQATLAGQDNPAIQERVVALALAMGDVDRVRQLADAAMRLKPKDPQSHLTLAAALDTQKDSAGAWREVLAALDLQPAFQPALVALGMMAKAPQQKEELRERYGKALQEKSAGASTYLEYARLLQDVKAEPDRIKKVLERGVVAQPASTALRQALVMEQMRAGQADAALSVAQAGAAANNASPDAVALLASVHLQSGNQLMAAETYRKLVTNYPQRFEWRLQLAELEAAADRKREAATLLRGLITDRPSDSTAYIMLAKLTWADNLSEALSIAKALGEKESHQRTAMLLEGDLLFLAGKYDDALQQFGKAAKAGAVPAARLRSIQVLDKAQREDAAEQELADSLRKFPDDPSVIGFAAQRARAQGKPAVAVEFLKKMAAKDASNPIVLNDLAWAQVEANQPEALKNATRAAELAPNSPQVLDTLAMAQAQGGLQTEAIGNLHTVINLAPTAVAPRLRLAELYINAGKPKEATQLMRALDQKKLSVKDKETVSRLTKLAA